MCYTCPVPGRDPFPGERPEDIMRKRAVGNRAVACGTCRNFDGSAWCRRWNFATDATSPICDQYRSGPVPNLAEQPPG